MEVIKTPKVGSFDSWICWQAKKRAEILSFSLLFFSLSKAFLCPAVLLWKLAWRDGSNDMLQRCWQILCWFIIKCEVSDRLPAPSHFLKRGVMIILVSQAESVTASPTSFPTWIHFLPFPRPASIINVNQIYFAVNGRRKKQTLLVCPLYNSRDQRKTIGLHVSSYCTAYASLYGCQELNYALYRHRLDEEKKL